MTTLEPALKGHDQRVRFAVVGSAFILLALVTLAVTSQEQRTRDQTLLDSSQEISVAKSMSLLRDYVARTVMLAEQASKKKATVKEQAAEKKVKEVTNLLIPINIITADLIFKQEIDPKFMANVTKQALAKMSKSLQQLGSELSTLSFIEGQQGVDCSR